MIVHSKGNIGSGLVVTCCWQGSVGVTNKVGCCCCCDCCCCCCVKADVYRAAAEVLAVADSQLPYSSSPALQAARLGLAHDRALHRGDARHSALFASQLLGLADPTDSVSKTLRYCSPSLTCCMCQNLSTHIWSNPTLPHLTAPHLTSPHRTSPHLTAPHRTSPHRTAPHLTSPHLTSPHLTSPHLTSPHLTAPHLTSPCPTRAYSVGFADLSL